MNEQFADLFKESKIFANREVLSPHYMPDLLPFRDKQINDIVKSLTPSLKGERGATYSSTARPAQGRPRASSTS